MMLSLVYASLLLAAGSNASPCKLHSGNWTSSSTTVAKAALHRDGHGSAAVNQNQKLGTQANAGLNLPLPYSQESPAPSSTSANNAGPSVAGSSDTSGTSDTSASLTPASGSCPQGFLNTVFNTNAGQSSGFPTATWNTLTEYGINNWSALRLQLQKTFLLTDKPFHLVGFSLDTLDKQADYDLSATQASQLSGAFNKAQIPIVMDHTYIQDAVGMLANNPPLYLELYNEPDFSFEGLTLTEEPAPSASDLKTLLDTPHPNTKFISPALMDANGPWLGEFFQACNGCIDDFHAIALHVYNPDPQGVLDQITQLYGTWNKTIWITELSPATAGCDLNTATMATYISTLIPEILKLGYVEKIFWNSGESDSTTINQAPAACSPSLTNSDGSFTPALQALGAACGINPGTATS
ncbi:hypothetical protein HO133_009166 [Letharia lupina]|uniref:Asl1-like glycosyl hydrolase catalytic domain-containing protein n=1 Tax=Letharia lupina TaxID=560253 RepID=A0A8H6CMU0_9LECA|nr:uncharacterized protein HO133_009166 [Letharia lupina]KAF6226300.1 hypothetical protein HO133_009166 [Letharia lupina]